MGRARMLSALRVVALSLAVIIALFVITELIQQQWNAAVQGAVVTLLCWLFAQRLGRSRDRVQGKPTDQGPSTT